MLTELEDRILAMSEGEWIDLATGAAILESWFDRVIDRSELDAAINRLMGSMLLQLKAEGSLVLDPQLMADRPLEALEIRATSFGEVYLAKTA